MTDMMKKMFFCIIPLILALTGCTSSGTAAVETTGNFLGIDLDAAIREAAAQMGENLPGGTEVALVSVASSSAQLSEYIIGRLEAALVGGKKLIVVDRANLDRIREEQGFQLSGEVDDNSAKAIGKLLGAGAIVTGAFANLGDVYSLTLKAINIETATVAASYPADIAKSTRIETLLASGGGAAGTQTAQRGTAGGGTAAQAAPPARIYQIGDIGPAGGIVFYDKFSSAGGWRYLEAAPQETEQELAWGHFTNLNGTRTEVGNGKQNTELIVQAGKNLVTAARLCGDLEYGGYDDWFLPSRDELDLIYKNLKTKGLGGFSGGTYWASSYKDGWDSGPWRQGFSDGDRSFDSVWTGSGGRNAYRVRAIRAF
jgi:hypothetical protein